MRKLFIAATSAFLVAGALTQFSTPAQATAAGCINSSTIVGSGTTAAPLDDSLGSLGVLCALPTGAAGGASSRWDTKISIGLAFSFGSGDRSSNGGVHLTGGIRRTNTDVSGHVDGGELHASINPLKWQDAQIRAMALYGGRDILGNAGLGWDFGGSEPIAAAGVQLPYTRALADYYVSSGNLRGFIEANSYGRLKAISRSGGGTSCATNQTLVNETSAASILNAGLGVGLGAAAPVFSGGILTGQVLTDVGDATSYAAINGTETANWLGGQTCLGGGPP